jgi:hypothetical protein
MKISLLKKNRASGIPKWAYAIPVIVVIALVASVPFKTKAHAFDIRAYYEANKDYYGADTPLEEVGREIYYRGGFDAKYPDFNQFAKAAGIDGAIQEDIKRRAPSLKDIKRRAPSLIDKLSKAGNAVLGVALPFRYDEEYIQGRLYRYDRFTKTVQQKYGAEWFPIPQLKNLQHARDVLTKAAIKRQFDELQEQQREMNWRNEEYLRRSLIR